MYVMKTDTFAKLFFLISLTGLVMYAILAFYTFHTAYTTMSEVQRDQDHLKGLPVQHKVYKFDRDLKYILIWTDSELPLITDFGNGQEVFIKHNCEYKNCFITTIKEYFGDQYTNFDAVMFDINVLSNWRNLKMPTERKPRQKYIFYSIIASDQAPICNIRADDFFNWTWSFKLYSDIVTPFIQVKDLAGEVVAPYPDVSWDPNMAKSEYNDSTFTSTKTKAVAWVIDKCITRAPRRMFAKDLQRALKDYALVMDIYGCRNLECPKEGCMKAIERDYYFYLAYEDSIEDDYVTAEVLKGYHNKAVPIVIGGADYTLFLPPGSYINARFMGAEKLAAFIHFSIKNPNAYLDFFKWKMFYTIEKTENQTGVCELCHLMNDHERLNSYGSYENFRQWWYSGPLQDRCYPKGTSKKQDWLSYIKVNTSHLKSTPSLKQ